MVLVYDKLAACASQRPVDLHHFYYVANAVTPGRFTYPAVTAECMYDPAVRAASASTPLRIDPAK